MEDTPVTGMQAILTAAGTILDALTGLLTDLTTWILADPLAIMFFGIMVIMLGVHLLISIVHRFS